jgi:hypothetical protein
VFVVEWLKFSEIELIIDLFVTTEICSVCFVAVDFIIAVNEYQPNCAI